MTCEKKKESERDERDEFVKEKDEKRQMRDDFCVIRELESFCCSPSFGWSVF